MDFRSTKEILIAAKGAVSAVAGASEGKLNLALEYMAAALIEYQGEILKANELDLQRAKELGEISSVMLDRLTLTAARLRSMADGILEVRALGCPKGKTLSEVIRPNGLKIKKIAVPFGVVAIIYESRPNVTSDAAALALKSGNVCVLRGGKEAFSTSFAIVKALREGIEKAGLPADSVNLIEDTSRASANELMRAEGLVDLLIPRGGAGLIRACVENATVPCVQTGTGICHIYVDQSADVEMALKIIENAKTSRPSVCNAAEVCLVHEGIAEEILPRLYDRLVKSRVDGGLVPVELRADQKALDVLGDGARAAGKDDFDTEFLDYVMALRVVDSVDAAIDHILAHSTHHSEAIIARDGEAIEKFAERVDSAAVYINASTRFTDGGEFGFGCEMGISTQKTHPRGPMGLSELNTYKYVIIGDGQIR